MKRFVYIICFVSSLFLGSAVFGQAAETSESSSNTASSDSSEAFSYIPELEAEEVTDLDLSKTKVIFKTNVKGCKIFLNGNLQGVSQLTLLNLVEGIYHLYVSKNDYSYKEYFIYVEHGKSKTFYIELEPMEKKAVSRNSVQASASSSSSKKTGDGDSGAIGDASSVSADSAQSQSSTSSTADAK